MGTEPRHSEPSPHWAPPSGPPVVPGGQPPTQGDPSPSGQPPSPPGYAPSGRPTGPEPDPVAMRRAGQLVLRFGLLVLASLLVSGLDLPWQAAAVAFSAPAVVVGVLAVRAVLRARMRAAAVVFTVTGVGLAGLMVLGQVAMLVLWPVQADYQKCRRDALTISAQRQCQLDYERRIEDLSRFGSRLS